MFALVGGELVLPTGVTAADLYVDKGKIVAIVKKGDSSPFAGDQTIERYDCTGKLVFPGFIDGHTHLEAYTGMDWTADSFETGTAAAVAGGTTTIVDYATADRGVGLNEALDTWTKRAEGNSAANFGFHMAMAECTPHTLSEIDDMFERGVTSFKTYFAYDHLRLNDGETFEVLRKLAKKDGLLCVHCENGDLINLLRTEAAEAGNLSPLYHALTRPDVAEAEAIAKLCYLAEEAKAKINIVHLSTKLGLEAIRDARARGQEVFVESCPQYFLLDESKYLGESDDLFAGAKYVMSPPLRKKDSLEALSHALITHEIDTLATDHCSFNYVGQKDRGRDDFRKIPNGGPGIEHRPALVMDHFRNELTALDFARLMSENPAKLFGMYPEKGQLSVGADADICVWDPSVTWTISAEDQVQNVDYTPYEGMRITGRADSVFVGGQLVAKQGKPTGIKPGTYVFRHTCSLHH